MPDRDELEHRVDALEQQGRELRSRVVGEVRAELRAHTSALNALRETQLEQGQTLGTHTRLLTAHSTILAHQGEVLDAHTRRFDEQDRKLDHIIDLLTPPEQPAQR